jgi:carbon storage regulator CsrA
MSERVKRKQNGGLVLARSPQESITITDSLGAVTVVTVSKISGNRVSLHINAPTSVKIVRTELLTTAVQP